MNFLQLIVSVASFFIMSIGRLVLLSAQFLGISVVHFSLTQSTIKSLIITAGIGSRPMEAINTILNKFMQQFIQGQVEGPPENKSQTCL